MHDVRRIGMAREQRAQGREVADIDLVEFRPEASEVRQPVAF
jgi:hypothetical protein